MANSAALRPARPASKAMEMPTMSLHERETVREQLEDCVFSGHNAIAPVPKYRFPRDETLARDAFQLVSDEVMLDGNARQNLATFCQTWEEPELIALMTLSVNKNMIDKDEYPQTAEIEARCVHMLADLWNAPAAANTVGASAIGSSEACMLAGMAAKWRWRAKRQAAGKPADKPNMVCGPVQVVWHKFARYWDIEMREVPMSHGHYAMDPADVLARVDENTIMVVPTFGVTYTGAYEPVEAISKALDQLQADTGLDVDIHVDGASGAFLAPFCAPDVLFDFRLPRVKSISTSGHKFGLAPLGVGWVIWRDRAELPDDLVFHVNYLGGDMPTFQINFSRPAGQVIAQYYNFLRLGHEGYRRIHNASYETGQYLAAEIVKLGPFELLCDSDPTNGIPTVTWRIREGADPGYTLFDLADRLRARGWQVPAYTLTGTASDIPVQRVLVRLGVSRDMASLLLDDFRDAIAHFGKHPVTVSMTKEESSGFSHL
jgi:glutamate decarboxylase